MNGTFALLILCPLFAAVLSFALGRRAAPLLWALTLGLTGYALAEAAWRLWQAGPFHHSLGGWGAPLGIELRVDGLSVMMLASVLPVVLATGFSALKRGSSGRFWPLFFFFWSTLNALFLSADLFNLYITLELLSLSSVGLIALSGKKEGVAAALRYLLAAMVGSLTYLLGVALIYGERGSLALEGLDLSGSVVGPWAVALIVLGLSLKAALFPFHFWLPEAYRQTPPPADALLAALGTKAAFFLLLRLWPSLSSGQGMEKVALLLAILGSAAVLWGSLKALSASNLRILLAYSSIAQTGYLFLAFTLMAGTDLLSVGGAAVLMISHAWAKGAMFLAADTIDQAIGSDRIADLQGVPDLPPVSLFALALGGITLMGLPPSGGFVAKWLLMKASLTQGLWWWALILALGGLLAAGYVFRIFGAALRAPEPPAPTVRPVALGPQILCLLLAFAAVLLGFAGPLPLDLLQRGGLP